MGVSGPARAVPRPVPATLRARIGPQRACGVRYGIHGITSRSQPNRRDRRRRAGVARGGPQGGPGGGIHGNANRRARRPRAVHAATGASAVEAGGFCSSGDKRVVAAAHRWFRALARPGRDGQNSGGGGIVPGPRPSAAFGRFRQLRVARRIGRDTRFAHSISE